MAILGLDVGTSATKAALVGEDGALLGVGRAAYAVDTPRPGWAEADPEAWLEAAARAVGRARAAAGTAHEPVRAVGLAGQMHGVVVCDADGRPARPALLWPDRRAVSHLDAWRALPRARRRALGNPLTPGMAGPLLAWLAEHEPAALATSRWALAPKDWVRLRLTGEAGTEPSDASATLLWDVEADAWAPDALAAARLDERRLAPLLASDAVAGTLRPAAGDALGLPAGLPVHAGAGDTAAALRGAGADAVGTRVLNVGTGAQLAVSLARPAPADPPVAHRFRHAGPGWYALAAVQNAGLALRWALDALAADWEEAEALAFGAQAPDLGDLLFVGHLSGERTPVLDAGARGAWFGLGLEHGRAHLLRAVFDGVAHGIRHARDALRAELSDLWPTGPWLLLGGGSLRPGYRQLLADVLGEELALTDAPEATARGAAVLGGARTVPAAPVSRVAPGPASAEVGDARHARWLAAVEALREARTASD